MDMVRFCSFWSITGLLSISSNRYDPPCKSKPRFIFLFNNSFSNLNKLKDAINMKNKEIKVIMNILIFEKYNTLFEQKIIF